MLEMQPLFLYGGKELDHLRSRDKRLAEAIDLIGPIRRGVLPDLFSALVNSIVGQQISTKAQQTIWTRMIQQLGDITPHAITAMPVEELQRFGISMRKAQYIHSAAEQICGGGLVLEELYHLPDSEVCARLSALKGIGVWTAEMLLLFSMQRPDVLSFDDLAIHRGMRMLYHHRSIDRTLFEKYRRRYSPYGSVASLYLWEIASGRHGHRDYAPVKKPAR